MRRLAVLLFLFASCRDADAPSPFRPEALDQLDDMAGCRDTGNSAWPLYEQIRQRFCEPAENAHYACCNVPGNPDWHFLGDWLQANRELLPLIEQATRKQHFGKSHHPAPGQEGFLALVDLVHARSLVNLLCAASREAEASGDLDLAMAYVDATARLGLQVAQRPLCLDRMIGLHLTGIAGREFRRLLYAQASSWTETQVAAFTRSPLLGFEPRSVAEAQRTERLLGEWEFEDEMQRAEDEAIAEIQQVRAVIALATFRRAHGRFPARIEELGDGVASTPRLRYLPPRGTRGPVLYRLRDGGPDPFADRDPDEWDPRKISEVYAVAPPR